MFVDKQLTHFSFRCLDVLWEELRCFQECWQLPLVIRAQTCASPARIGVMFKTSQWTAWRFISAVPDNYCVQPVKRGHLARWHRRARQGAALAPACDWLSSSVVCHQAFLLTLWLPCLFSATDYLPLALTSRSPIIWILPPPFPTGVVIPSPQRRLNDFILPRLSFPANDVPRSIILWCWLPESAGVWALVLLASRGGGIMREQFRGSKNLGSKKRRGWIDTKAGFFMCCQHAFLWSVRCLSETPPV